jgi:hypothetical protein
MQTLRGQFLTYFLMTRWYKIFILTILSVSDLDPHSCALILLSWILIRIIVQYLTFFFVRNAESWKAL